MTEKEAVRVMVSTCGEDAIYDDGGQDWSGDNLVDEAEGWDDEDDGYCYSRGPFGTAPGVYRTREGGYLVTPAVIRLRK